MGSTWRLAAAQLDLVTGLAMAGIGIWRSVQELPESLRDLHPSAHHGIALVGLFLLVRSLSEIGLHVHHSGKKLGPTGRLGRFYAWIASPRVEAAVGVMVVCASLGQVLGGGAHRVVKMWHWGTLVLGLGMVCRVGAVLHEGFEHLEHETLPQAIRSLAGVSKSSSFRLGLAIAILAFSLFEVGVPAAFLADGTPLPGLHGGHALLLYAASRIAQTLRDVASAYKLTRVADEEAPESEEEPETVQEPSPPAA